MTETQCQVLIVDDQKVVRHTLSLCLRNLGYENCYEASNGKEAKRVIAEQQIDVIFCDLNMPVEDGFEVLRYLGASHYQGAIVLMSSEEQEVLESTSQLAKQYHLNIIECLAKPLTFDTVNQALTDYSGAGVCKAKGANHDNLLKAYSPKQVAQFIERGEIRAYFQPQIALCSGEIQGFEVLARVESQTHGFVMPDQFIPSAESDPLLIIRLTKSVITRAFDDIQFQWPQISQKTFSFNISRKVLEDNSFPGWLKETCHQYSIPCESIVCELTETALQEEQAIVDAQMLRMRMLKFKLSIDDFGTGYSSIAQLHAIPFNELKIDKRFIFDCLTNSKSAAVVEQSIKMARAMGLTVVAEGIENEAVCDFLQQLNCDAGQGYFYAKPAPLARFLLDERLNMQRHSR